jgi:hypothetical protein
MSREKGGAAVAAAVIGGVATIVAAIITVSAATPGRSKATRTVAPTTSNAPPAPRPTPPTSNAPRPVAPPAETAIFLSKESAPGGATVKVSGRGFDPGETVVIRVHTEQVATTNADGGGQFDNVAITVPTSLSVFAPHQFSVVATGQSSVHSASAPLTVSG